MSGLGLTLGTGNAGAGREVTPPGIIEITSEVKTFQDLIIRAKTTSGHLDLTSPSIVELLRKCARKSLKELKMEHEIDSTTAADLKTPTRIKRKLPEFPPNIGLHLLVRAINNNRHITSVALDLSDCKLNDDNCDYLSRLDKDITRLNLSDNECTLTGYQSLVGGLWATEERKATFNFIDLSNNPLHGKGKTSFVGLDTPTAGRPGYQYDLEYIFKRPTPTPTTGGTAIVMGAKSVFNPIAIAASTPAEAYPHPRIRITHNTPTLGDRLYPIIDGKLGIGAGICGGISIQREEDRPSCCPVM